MNHRWRAGAAALAVAVPLAALIGQLGVAESATRVSVRFTAKPAAVAKSNDATFRIGRSVKKGIKGQYFRLDSGRWRTTRGTVSLADLADGKHTAHVKLVMKNGRKAVASYTWRVDSAAPAAPRVDGSDERWSNAASRTVTHEASADPAPSSGAIRYERRISEDGGQTWSPADAAEKAIVSREGDTRVQFRAVDAAGNASEWSEAIVRLDRTAPGPADLTGGMDEWRSVASAEIVNHKDATDALSGIPADGYQLQIRRDEDGYWVNADIDGDGALTIRREGATEVRVRAIDRAGNAGDWTPAAVVQIDRTAPRVPSVTGTEWSNAASATVTATSPGDTLGALTGSGVDHYVFQTQLNGVTSEPVQTDGTLTWSEEGYTVVTASACDAAGNCSDFSPIDWRATIRLDRTPPSVPWATGTSGDATCTGYKDSVYLNVYAYEHESGLHHFEYIAVNELGDTIQGTSNGYLNITNQDITGRVVMQFVAVDQAGNRSEISPVDDVRSVICLA